MRGSASAVTRAVTGQAPGQQLLVTCAAVAAVAGALAAGRPTGLAGPDAVLRAAFAAGMVLCVARAPRWAWLLVGAVAAALAGSAPVAAAAGWAALLVALVAAAVRTPRPGHGVLVGLLAAVAVLRLPPTDPAWLPGAAVALTSAVVALVVYAGQPDGTRRRVRHALSLALGGAALATAGALAGAARGARAVDAGLDHARAGRDAIAAGETGQAGAELDRARAAFAEADAALNAWHTQPARLVPVLSQQSRALGELAALAHHLAAAGSETITRVDYRSLGVEDGRVDVDRIRALGPPLDDVVAALAAAEAGADAVGTDWVVPAIRRHHAELRQEAASTHRDARRIRAAVHAAPALLGADGPRRYFIAFTTPAEARGMGGFMGNFAVLTAEDGRLALTRNDRTAAIEPTPGDPPRRLEGPPDYVARYGSTRPHEWLRDVTQSPDFPSVAEVIASAYPQAPGGTPIDGVIAADPYAIAGILALTGPVPVEGLDEPLTAANAADILLRRQYATFAGINEQRIDVLGRAAHAAFDALLDVRSVEPTQWAATLGPLVERRRLLVTSTHPGERGLFRDLGLDGAFPPAGDGDFFALTTTNFGNNKIDAYLHRSVDYRVDWDPDRGLVRARARITLRNEAPPAGLSPYVIRNRATARQPDGTNWLALDFYSPHQLAGATVVSGDPQGADGRSLPMTRGRELGRNVYRGLIAVPSRSSVTLELDLQGAVPPGTDYRVGWYQQPTVHADDLTIAVEPPAEWTLPPAWHARSDRDGTVSFASVRPAT